MIKLIASDVDGTLIPEGSPALHPEFQKVIQKLKEKGIVFAAASGRSYGSVRSVFQESAEDVYFISNNGAVVRYQDETLFMRSIEEATAERLLEYFREKRTERNAFFLMTSQEQDFTECDDEELVSWIRDGYKVTLSVLPDVSVVKKPFVKMSIYFGDIDAAEMLDEAKERFGDELAVLISGAHWIDFVHKDAEKGNALAQLQKQLGITREETMAFGDNYNDISLLLAAEESYAVSEARDAVKEVVKYILPDTTTATVLDVLKGLLV
ncbi:MAG: Cof-type HAD-IIB family hydrolase [Dorea sp.]|nr:Cof-type HAD-IIB family hydrolase [Dorea sp.]